MVGTGSRTRSTGTLIEHAKVRLLDGEVITEGDDALSPTERAEGIILACRVQARRDLTVDA